MSTKKSFSFVQLIQIERLKGQIHFERRFLYAIASPLILFPYYLLIFDKLLNTRRSEFGLRTNLKDLCIYTTYTFIKTPQRLANNNKLVYSTDTKHYFIFNNKIFVNATNRITLYLIIHGNLIELKVHPIKARPFGK